MKLYKGFLSLFIFLSIFTYAQELNTKKEKPGFVGIFSGNFFEYFPDARARIIKIAHNMRICTFGKNIIDEILKCERIFQEDAIEYCSIIKANFVAISNFRISQSNLIRVTSIGREYGHIVILYGDVICLE